MNLRPLCNDSPCLTSSLLLPWIAGRLEPLRIGLDSSAASNAIDAIIDGHIFALDNIGSAGPITNLVCVNIANGKQVWMKKRFGKSNLTLADGRLFISTMKGELVIVDASADSFPNWTSRGIGHDSPSPRYCKRNALFAR